MKKIKSSLLLIISVLGLNVVGQTPALNKQKYDTYRENLKYFRVEGDNYGDSYGEDLIAERRTDIFETGDGLLNQGWYIGVLATEYQVLIQENNFNDAQKTLNELYCALEAVERLDRVADSRYYWYQSGPWLQSNRDGMAVRTDAWNDVIPQYPSPFYNKLNEPYPTSTGFYPWVDVVTTEKEFYGPDLHNDAPPYYYHTFLSQDQLYHLLMGLYLTYTQIPNISVTVDTKCAGIQNVNFSVKAKNIALTFIEELADNDFKLIDPGGNSETEPVSIPQFFAKPLKELALKFGSTHNFPSETWNLYYGWFANIPLSFDNQIDNRHTALVMAAISNWSFNPSGFGNNNAWHIMSASESDPPGPGIDWTSFYPLLHNYLYGTNPMPISYYCDVENELNSAPLTNPENSANGGPYGWRTFSRFLKEQSNANDGMNDGNLSFQGKFSGIDYMLLYNLFQLRKKSVYYDIQNYMSGSNVRVASHIISPSKVFNINQNTSLQYLAYEKISLINGFRVYPGATFNANIVQVCGSGRTGIEDGGFNDNSLEDETVQEKLATTSFVNIYPNPNTGQFNVAVKSNEGNLLIEVYDVMGKQVFSENVNSTNKLIDISEQPRGIYLVKITANNQVFTEKIIYQ